MRSQFWNGFWAFCILAFSFSQASAKCLSSELVWNRHRSYDGCHIVFEVIDVKTQSPFQVKLSYDSHQIEQSSCKAFCKGYNDGLSQSARYDQACKTQSHGSSSSHISCEDDLVEKNLHILKESSSEVTNNAGVTNTVTEFGVYHGAIDSTEAIGAFDDLAKVGFFNQKGKNLDVGGGKFDHTTSFLRGFGIQNEVYDPYNRSLKHNGEVLKKSPFDSVTSVSILNVILSEADRKAHIELVHKNLKMNGQAYFKVYEGNKSGQNEGFQSNRRTASYLHEIEEVFGKGNVELRVFQNLIIAKKIQK